MTSTTETSTTETMTTETMIENDLTAMLQSLGTQREHVLGILEGLDEEALRRPVLASGWSCLGLVRHLTLDDERFWFSAVVAGDPAAIEGLAAVGNAWEVGADESAEQILEAYRQEGMRSDELITAAGLAAAPAWWPDGLFGDWRMDDVRQIVLHVITETACHAGHIDAARELIDGRQWMVL